MEFDTKQKVLLALYLEYQKDVPKMETITAELLELDSETFKQAVRKLENEELIEGIKFSRIGNQRINIFLETAMVKSLGLIYIEHKLGLDEYTSAQEKLKIICQNAAGWTWTKGRELAEETLLLLL